MASHREATLDLVALCLRRFRTMVPPSVRSSIRLLRATIGLACAALGSACADGGAPAAGSGEPAASASAVASSPSAAAPPVTAASPIPVRVGGALARAVEGDALWLADEDHRTVRRVALPLGEKPSMASIELPGAPVQVLPLDGRVLVTVRDPGLVLELEPTRDGGLVERARVAVDADAWGLAVTRDASIALVTSAWTSKVAAIDLATRAVLWTIDVAREPRAVVIDEAGTTAWITHLTGGELTRLSASAPAGLRERPTVARVALPPAPFRAPSGVTLGASLGYAAALSPDGARLFVARHALGALGDTAWFGASTVDVLLTADASPLAPARHSQPPFLRADRGRDGTELAVPPNPLSPFTQPRALALRRRTNSVLVASEGSDLVAELDASALDPTRAVLATYRVGRDYEPNLGTAGTCGAPTGLALSDDERTAWVFCRATYDLATIALADFGPEGAPDPKAAGEVVATTRLADDPLADAIAAAGRRLFYNATDRVTSGGLGCAGCHPEGRDDGHTWHEARFNTRDGTQTNFVGHEANLPSEEGLRGHPRRTPMLAGRVASQGPYGWHGESPTLPARLEAGFTLHRWGGMPKHDVSALVARSERLTRFLRQGLVAPPVVSAPLEPLQSRGRELFNSPSVGCATCHAPESGFTTRAVVPLTKLPPRAGFDAEENEHFKTPSLHYLAGRAPYFHDGRAPSIEWILDNNPGDRMGKTSHLSADDRAALAAYLKTL
jgi:DNA-binding beta-propeller fold protein YncE/mono/diheme cytochrome c family protein